MACYRTRKLLAWYCGDRSTASLERLMLSFNQENIGRANADHWDSYREFFPHNKLIQLKKNTYQIERNSGQQRHWLAHFKQGSIVVARFLEMPEISLWLFARFRINGDICELTSLLR